MPHSCANKCTLELVHVRYSSYTSKIHKSIVCSCRNAGVYIKHCLSRQSKVIIWVWLSSWDNVDNTNALAFLQIIVNILLMALLKYIKPGF